MTSRSRGRTSSNRPLDNCGLGVSCIAPDHRVRVVVERSAQSRTQFESNQ